MILVGSDEGTTLVRGLTNWSVWSCKMDSGNSAADGLGKLDKLFLPWSVVLGTSLTNAMVVDSDSIGSAKLVILVEVLLA